MITKIQEAMKCVEELSVKLGYPLTSEDYVINDLGCPHKPNTLPLQKSGVYMFFYNGEAMKIGKANEGSGPRFLSQHYYLKAPSTLAKSIVFDAEFVSKGVTEENVGAWIKENMHRVDIVINGDSGDAATELIESIMHYTFRPRYEGSLHRKGGSCRIS